MRFAAGVLAGLALAALGVIALHVLDLAVAGVEDVA